MQMRQNRSVLNLAFLYRTAFYWFCCFLLLEDFGVSRIIYTDINRDGTKTGVNFSQLKKIVTKVSIPLVVSGGVSDIKDIIKLHGL